MATKGVRGTLSFSSVGKTGDDANGSSQLSDSFPNSRNLRLPSNASLPMRLVDLKKQEGGMRPIVMPDVPSQSNIGLDSVVWSVEGSRRVEIKRVKPHVQDGFESPATELSGVEESEVTRDPLLRYA